MSLFDIVQFEYPLPDPQCQNADFKTQDLGERLHRYLIAKDGRLWRRHWGVHFFGAEAQPADHDLLEEDMHYHGDIRLHARTSTGEIVYRVRFTHGVVEWIRRVEAAEPAGVDSLKRLAWEAADFEQEHAERLEELLQRLEALDPEVAQQAVFVFEDRVEAALWLTSLHLALGKRSPYELLARGQRQEVLEALMRFLHGIPS